MTDQNPLELQWVVPRAGDHCSLQTEVGERAADVSYLRQVAAAADALGFRRALIPVGAHGGDAWIVATWRRIASKPRSRAARPMRGRSGPRTSPSPKQSRASAAAH